MTVKGSVKGMKETLRTLNRQLAEFREMVEERDRELADTSMELALALSEVFEALKRISSGHPLVRVPETSERELITKLKHMVNLSAENLAEIVDLSHEFAIGLAEHFDVLNRALRGDMTARISGISNLELLEHLKKVTNEMIESISMQIVRANKAEAELRQTHQELEIRVKKRTTELEMVNERLKEEINERSRAEQALRESEEKLRTVADYSYDWEYWRGVDGNYIYVSPACKRITGYSPDDFSNDQSLLVSLVHPDDRGILSKHFTGEVKLQKPFSFNFRIFAKNGEVRWIRHTCQPVYSRDGKWLGQRASNRNITARKLAEDALEESERRFRTLFATAQDFIFIKDRNLKYSLINPSMERFLGLPASRIIGMTAEDIYGREEGARIKKKDLRILEGETIENEHKVSVKGISATIQSTKVPMRDKDNNIIGVYGIGRDVTEKRKLEFRLQNVQKMQAIGQLAAGVAHEINNPLTTILTTSMLLQEDLSADDPNYQELEMIANETLRCRKIVTGLLDFARESKPVMRKHNINDIVEHSLLLTRKHGDFKNIALELNSSKGIPQIYVDKDKIQQALINLTLNAIEATDSGGKVTFTTRFLKEDDMVEIVVSDTGKGIPSEDLDRLFEPFFTSKKGGTGLGLSITHGIIQQHGGAIDVHSHQGKGTTFTIRLPIGKGDKDAS